MTTQITCPECGVSTLATLGALHGAEVLTEDGFWLDDQGNKLHYEHSGETEVFWDDQKTIGIVCTGCGWDYRGADWEDYLVNMVEREKERIRREFLREMGQEVEELSDDDLRTIPLTHDELAMLTTGNPLTTQTKDGEMVRVVLATADDVLATNRRTCEKRGVEPTMTKEQAEMLASPMENSR